jgi:hypothetical protein
MKTGRVRKKAAPPPQEPEAPPPTQPSSPAPTPPRPASGPAQQPRRGIPTLPILLGIFGCLVLAAVLAIVLGGGGAKEWVEVTRADGEWTTTVILFGPQVTTEERWEVDCLNDPNAAVRASTCLMKDSDRYNDKVVDEYDEYAYKIYHEETHDQVYEASGTEFVVTQLKSDDWWEDSLHYVLQEELDKESCQYSDYTVWVDDPQDATQEIEVYLSECEVWDHVTVYERVYEQKAWCQCDVTTLMQVGQESGSGSGVEIRWPNPSVPAGGRTERSFSGQVTFLGSDYTYTTTTQDLAEYQDYLTGQYYLGIKDGRAVSISKNPPKK